MNKLFVYGTLKRNFRNHYLLEDCPFIGYDELRFYDMHSVGGFPCIVPGSGLVFGEVYEIPDYAWPRLDRLEGVPHMYRRIEHNEFYYYEWNQSVENLPLVESGIWTKN